MVIIIMDIIIMVINHRYHHNLLFYDILDFWAGFLNFPKCVVLALKVLKNTIFGSLPDEKYDFKKIVSGAYNCIPRQPEPSFWQGCADQPVQATR